MSSSAAAVSTPTLQITMTNMGATHTLTVKADGRFFNLAQEYNSVKPLGPNQRYIFFSYLGAPFFKEAETFAERGLLDGHVVQVAIFVAPPAIREAFQLIATSTH